MTKKMSPDMAADFASSESLSFAGLLCIQEQTKEHPQVQKQDAEFEFSCSNPGSIIGSPNNNLSADKLYSDDKISSNQHQIPKRIGLGDLLSEIPGHKKRSHMKQSSLRSNSTTEQIPKVKRGTNEKGTMRQKSFGQKLFSSFATPCRDCRSLEPTPRIKQQMLK